MKKTIQLFVLLTLSCFAFAQTKLKEGVANFEITYPALTPEMKQMEGMLPKTLTIYFKNEWSRIEMPMAMGTTTTVGNNTKKEVTIMMDMMGQKFAIKQEEEMKKNGEYPTFKITPATETKTIAGYLCKKAIISYTLNGKTEKMDCYYTEALPKMNSGNDNPAFKNINGFLMEYNINQGGMKMRIQAKSIKAQTVSDTQFKVPADYKIMTQEEVAEMMMGGAGK
jgi:GLPGLI family protein